MKTASNVLTILLVALCAALSAVVFMQCRRIHVLRELSASAPDVNISQEQRRSVPVKKSLPSNETAVPKRAASGNENLEERQLKRQIRADGRRLENSFKEKFPEANAYMSGLPQIYTLEQLEEVDAEAFKAFVQKREEQSRELRDKNAARVEMLERLDSELLPEDEFKFLQDRIKKQITADVCRFEFKDPPFSNDDGDYVVPEKPLDKIISSYCANSIGISDNLDVIECISEMDFWVNLDSYHLVRPIVVDKNPFIKGK